MLLGGARQTETAVTNVTQYIYDNEDILLELDGSNNIVARYTHGPSIDEPLTIEKSNQSFFYHADALGSIAELTDSNGTVVQSYTYSSFGKIESQLDPTFVQPYTFTAREFDSETGLYYYRDRYYDAKTGRFLSEDPLGITVDPKGFPGEGVNQYEYAGNNPVNFTDPFGLQPRTPAKGKPNSQETFHKPDGGRTVRFYGPDGKAIKDVDYGHDFKGAGDPHVHDWDWSKKMPRQEERSPRPGDIPIPIVPPTGGLICPLPLIIPSVPLLENLLDSFTGGVGGGA